MRTKIGESLVQAGLITDEDRRRALLECKRTGERLGVVLVRMNLATEEQIARALAFQLGFSYLNLVENPPDPSAVALIAKDVALKRVCVAVSTEKNALTVAMADPLLFSLVQDLELQTGHRIKQVVSTPSEIIDAIHTGYGDKALVRADQPASGLSPTFEPAVGSTARNETAPMVDLVDLIVQTAIKRRASDIHVEPMEEGLAIRYRLDGMLKGAMNLPTSVHEGVIARLKAMAGMDIAETRLPQDGRIRVRAEDGTDVDFRVSTLRTVCGEKVVMRVLDHRKGVPALEEIGMSAAALAEMRKLLLHQHGMILVVGPSGSGKTTTLSSALSALKSEKANIITVEDPVEYQISGVNQTQINEQGNLTFASALRSILRQDPDVILLGEIRDAETATVAMQAAAAGRLVLSALHTDDAPSSVMRLMGIGIDPLVIASALVGVVAQRLVRRLCLHCRRQYTPPADLLRSLGVSEADAATIVFYRAVGCDQCSHTGYRGRIGIYEVMRVTDTLQRLIASRAQEDQIRAQATADGMVTLGEDGLSKVKGGITTAEELLRVVTELRDTRALCAGCGAAVGADFKACPACGMRIDGGCPHCGRAIQPGWNFCPYCAGSTETRKAPTRLRDRQASPGRRERPASNVAEFKKS